MDTHPVDGWGFSAGRHARPEESSSVAACLLGFVFLVCCFGASYVSYAELSCLAALRT